MGRSISIQPICLRFICSACLLANEGYITHWQRPALPHMLEDKRNVSAGRNFAWVNTSGARYGYP